MKYFPLLWAELWRKPLRTVFKLLSIMVAFVLFGILSGIDAGFAHALEISRQDRLSPRRALALLYPSLTVSRLRAFPALPS